MEALDRFAIDTSQQGGQAAYLLAIVLQHVGKYAVYADMCANALIGILLDKFVAWNPEAISVLAMAADDYMTEVEDVFLSHSTSPHSENDTLRINLEDLRGSLGL